MQSSPRPKCRSTLQRPFLNPVNNHLVKKHCATQINKYAHKTTFSLLPLTLFKHVKNNIEWCHIISSF